MIACCGLDCSQCGAFKATAGDDDDLRRRTAEEWSKMFGSKIAPEDINCTGCSGTGVRFNYCDACEIRKCATGRRLDTCADCREYACGKLEEFLKNAPAAKENLENLRSGGAGS